MASEASSSSFNNVPKLLKVSCSGSGGGGGGKDRLSGLPDAILGSILSSLSTKEAVGTSILSPRWRYVWTSVPHIEIYDYEYSYKSCTTREYKKECFRDFVDRVLRLNNVACLPKMSLSCCDDDYNGRRFPEWIRALTVRDIHELVLQFLGKPHVMLPHSLFMCKNLVILNLDNDFVLDVPTSVCLVHLKVLRLGSVQIFDENTMKNLLAGCPVIEELKIEENLKFLHSTESMTTLYIQTSSLKSLTMNNVYIVYSKTSILIDAVNLERIDVTIPVEIERFEVHSNLSSLVSVCINLDDFSPNALRKMSSTKYLSLSCNTMQSLRSANLNDLPMFPYLTHLVVEIADYSWHVLPHLLRCSPNLITFDLDLECEYDREENEEFDMSNFSMLHLESVNLHGLGWSKYEMDMVKYFLKYAPVLKKMSIYFVDPPEDSNLSNEILLLPRASTECELKIFS